MTASRILLHGISWRQAPYAGAQRVIALASSLARFSLNLAASGAFRGRHLFSGGVWASLSAFQARNQAALARKMSRSGMALWRRVNGVRSASP